MVLMQMCQIASLLYRLRGLLLGGGSGFLVMCASG